jgi:hypothetical protein
MGIEGQFAGTGETRRTQQALNQETEFQEVQAFSPIRSRSTVPASTPMGAPDRDEVAKLFAEQGCGFGQGLRWERQ